MNQNKTEWVWTGNDQGLMRTLQEIDKRVVKIEKDTDAMEKGMTRAMKGSARSIDYLKDRVEKLRIARDSAFDEKKIARFNQQIRQTETQMRRMETLGMSRSQKWASAMGQMPIGGQLMAFGTNPYALAGMGALAVGGLISNSVSQARDRNVEMAKINATAQLTPQRLMALRSSLFSTANRLDVDVNSLPGAYESIISATGDKAAADRLFIPAVQLAKAGFTDASITGRALSQISMTPGVAMNENQIADMLMAAKNYGRGELSDFANYLPGLISTGKLRGFSEQDVTGSYSYLTRSNSAEQASTLLSNFMNVVLRKDVTDEIRKRIKVDVFDKDGELRDMSNILGDIGKAMNGLSDRGKQAFLDSIKVVDQQAFQALGALTAESDQLKKAIDTVTNSTGELNRTLEFTKTGNESLIKFRNNWALLTDNLGSVFLPIANNAMGHVNNLFKAIKYIASSEEERNAETRRENNELFKRNFGIAESFARETISRYSNLPAGDQVAAAMDDIRERLYGMGVKVSPQASKAMQSALMRMTVRPSLGSQTPESITGAPDLSTTAERVMAEHKQVRNVTVNIDTLQRIESVLVGKNEDLSQVTGNQVLNGFLKLVRDAEQSLQTR